MKKYRHQGGKNPYRANKYKSELYHNRAVHAESDKEKQAECTKDFYSEEQSPRTVYAQKSNRFADGAENQFGNNFDVYDEQPQVYRTNRNMSPTKKNNSNGKKAVLIVFAVLVLTMIGFGIAQVVNTMPKTAPVQETQANSSAAETLTSTVSTSPSVPAKEAVQDTAADVFTPAAPEDNQAEGDFDNGYYIWNNKAFELFYGTDESAKRYADAMNLYADKLGENIQVYTMVIPTHVEMGLPSRLTDSGTVSTNSQAENIGSIYKNLKSNVTPVNCYNALSTHCNAYIYFNTDHHWTGLGAYYAYTAFAGCTGQEVLSLENCTKNEIEGFYGTLSNDVSAELPADTVEYWEFPYETSNDLYYESNGEPQNVSVYYTAAEGGSLTYGVFAWGDQPLEVLHSDRNTGKKIAIVKESFGNALVPYFTYNYDETHVIDFRYWEGNLKTYCQENGITEVLFANGVMSANTEGQIEAMNTLFE